MNKLVFTIILILLTVSALSAQTWELNDSKMKISDEITISSNMVFISDNEMDETIKAVNIGYSKIGNGWIKGLDVWKGISKADGFTLYSFTFTLNNKYHPASVVKIPGEYNVVIGLNNEDIVRCIANEDIQTSEIIDSGVCIMDLLFYLSPEQEKKIITYAPTTVMIFTDKGSVFFNLTENVQQFQELIKLK